MRSSNKNENFQFQTSSKTYATQATFDIKVSSTTHASLCTFRVLVHSSVHVWACLWMPIVITYYHFRCASTHSWSTFEMRVCVRLASAFECAQSVSHTENSVRGENSMAPVPAKRTSQYSNTRQKNLLLFLNWREQRSCVRTQTRIFGKYSFASCLIRVCVRRRRYFAVNMLALAQPKLNYCDFREEICALSLSHTHNRIGREYTHPVEHINKFPSPFVWAQARKILLLLFVHDRNYGTWWSCVCECIWVPTVLLLLLLLLGWCERMCALYFVVTGK